MPDEFEIARDVRFRRDEKGLVLEHDVGMGPVFEWTLDEQEIERLIAWLQRQKAG